MATNTIASRLGPWFWRLVPANPILVRVVQGGSRRVRHLWLRLAYLSVLLFVVLVVMMTDFSSEAATLSSLAKNASTMFMWASMTQLALMCFLAPVFTASAITQERDAQTFNILISTPLSNAQIVLGSLMSRLYFVVVLLIGGLPIFLLTMLYGGVTLSQIIQSFSIAGSTAILTGSLAITISMVRVGTRRTIFSFYLMIAMYLLAVYALGKWDATWIEEAPVSIGDEKLSWLAAFHPFLALDVALNRIPAPDPSVLGDRNGLATFFLAYPHRAYVVITLLSSVLLTAFATFFVRRSKEGETGLLRGLFHRVTRTEGGERRRKPRRVWKNPVAWREATSRASVATRSFLQVTLIGGGLVIAILLLLHHLDTGDLAQTREWLSMVLMIELGLILIVATNTAATTITKEKESKSLEMLLATPVTSQYLVWGKLRGLITFTVPLVAIPTITVAVFSLHGLFVGPEKAVVPIEAFVEAGCLLIAFASAACMFGMYASLHSRKTVHAVMWSVGVVVVACLVSNFIFDSIVTAANRSGAAVAPFTPFTAIRTLADPARMFDGSNQKVIENLGSIRAFAASGTALAVIFYVSMVGWSYKSMVRNFDMTVRKQSGSV
jgi:ABC-type transport system involved in multi-copper enzyme maturation permease subunit